MKTFHLTLEDEANTTVLVDVAGVVGKQTT